MLASVVAAVAMVALVSTWRDSAREAARQTERLGATAAVIAAMTGEAAYLNDRDRAFAAIRVIGATPDIVYARIETADGALLAEAGAGVRLSRDARLASGGPLSLASVLRSRTVEVAAPVVFAKRPVGRVVLLGRLEGVGPRLLASLLLGLAAAVAAGTVGMAVAWRLQRRLTGPILALTGAMESVRRDHDFRGRVEITTDDEVGDLVDGFNAMLDEVRLRDEAIAGHLAGLERTVAERTADLSAAKAQADAANSAKSDFLATMSHEIRTPMNGVMVMAEMLAAGDLPPRQRRFAEVIAKSGSSLLAIINDILDFSKIEAGKMDLEAAPVDPGEIADDVCSLFWEKARSQGLDLAAYVDPATPRLIEGDAVRLRQVVGNLLNNAIKFTERGGVFLEVSTPAPGRLRVAVRDTGIGIPKDKLAGLFSAFSQADQSTTRRFGGTGLGLAICKRLVDAMGGEVTVRSTVGRGAEFAFEVPVTVLEAAPPPLRVEGAIELRLAGGFTRLAAKRYAERAGLRVLEPGAGEPGALVLTDPVDAPTAHAKSGPVVCLGEYGDAAPARLLAEGRIDATLVQPFRRRDLDALLAAWSRGAPLVEALAAGDQAERGATPMFTGRRVLVADDAAVNREVAMEALARLGVTTAVAVDGLDAVRAAFETPYDLILMDGSMPQMDGYDATREIRRREALSGARRRPIVALTAHVVGDAADAWREAGMDAVLHKPFTLAGLAKVLGQFLEPSAAAPEQIGPMDAVPARKPAAIADPTLFDPEVVAELAAMADAGRGDFVARVRGLYRDNAPEAGRRVSAAVAAGDAAEVARAAHALKSMSLNIGARAVADLAARLESAGREGGVDPAQALALADRLAQTLDALEAPAAAVPTVVAAPAEDAADLALLADLAGAAERGELKLVYQRQMDRDGQDIVGVETLLRWNHPERGEVSPAVFIPLAERYGMIRPITQWVLARTLEETKDLAGLSVGFNASAVEFSDPRFVEDVAMLIAAHRFDPARLVIEITETAILNDGDEVRRSIARLHELGVKIALDDFGVGYSSLSHLRMFAFDKLKIDKTFVNACAVDVQSATLVHAVVSVGRALGMKVVAEGVETEAQRKFLKIAGVHALQGYLFGLPESVGDLRETLAQARQAPSAAAG